MYGIVCGCLGVMCEGPCECVQGCGCMRVAVGVCGWLCEHVQGCGCAWVAVGGRGDSS